MKSEDLLFLVTSLHRFSAKWKEIGLSLNFLADELDCIGHNKELMQCLVELLKKWSQWPTDDHQDSPTIESLCDALHSPLVGLGAAANELYELRNLLPSQTKKFAEVCTEPQTPTN